MRQNFVTEFQLGLHILNENGGSPVEVNILFYFIKL